MQPDQQHDHHHQQQQQQEVMASSCSSPLPTSTADDVTESRDDDVIDPGRQLAAEFGFEVELYS